MSALITTLFVLTALLLIGVILIQQPKTAGGLFSGTGQSLLGASGKTFWVKFTTILAAVFMALCLLQSLFPGEKQGNSVADVIEQQQQQQAAQQQAAQQQAPAVPPPAGALKAQSNPAPQAQSKPVPVVPSKK